MKHKNKHNIWKKIIAIGVLCLFLFNQMAWAYPADTLATNSLLDDVNAEGDRQEFDKVVGEFQAEKDDNSQSLAKIPGVTSEAEKDAVINAELKEHIEGGWAMAWDMEMVKDGRLSAILERMRPAEPGETKEPLQDADYDALLSLFIFKDKEGHDDEEKRARVKRLLKRRLWVPKLRRTIIESLEAQVRVVSDIIDNPQKYKELFRDEYHADFDACVQDLGGRRFVVSFHAKGRFWKSQVLGHGSKTNNSIYMHTRGIRDLNGSKEGLGLCILHEHMDAARGHHQEDILDKVFDEEIRKRWRWDFLTGNRPGQFGMPSDRPKFTAGWTTKTYHYFSLDLDELLLRLQNLTGEKPGQLGISTSSLEHHDELVGYPVDEINARSQKVLGLAGGDAEVRLMLKEEIQKHSEILLPNFENTTLPRWHSLTGSGAHQIGLPIDKAAKCARLLTQDYEGNTYPTYYYLTRFSPIEAESVYASPSLLTHSLNDRIRPRILFLTLRGHLQDVGSGIIRMTNEKFKEWLERETRVKKWRISRSEYESFLRNHRQKEVLFGAIQDRIKDKIPDIDEKTESKLKAAMNWLRIHYDEMRVARKEHREQDAETHRKEMAQDIERAIALLPGQEKDQERNSIRLALQAMSKYDTHEDLRIDPFIRDHPKLTLSGNIDALPEFAQERRIIWDRFHAAIANSGAATTLDRLLNESGVEIQLCIANDTEPLPAFGEERIVREHASDSRITIIVRRGELIELAERKEQAEVRLADGTLVPMIPFIISKIFHGIRARSHTPDQLLIPFEQTNKALEAHILQNMTGNQNQITDATLQTEFASLTFPEHLEMRYRDYTAGHGAIVRNVSGERVDDHIMDNARDLETDEAVQAGCDHVIAALGDNDEQLNSLVEMLSQQVGVPEDEIREAIGAAQQRISGGWTPLQFPAMIGFRDDGSPLWALGLSTEGYDAYATEILYLIKHLLNWNLAKRLMAEYLFHEPLCYCLRQLLHRHGRSGEEVREEAHQIARLIQRAGILGEETTAEQVSDVFAGNTGILDGELTRILRGHIDARLNDLRSMVDSAEQVVDLPDGKRILLTERAKNRLDNTIEGAFKVCERDVWLYTKCNEVEPGIASVVSERPDTHDGGRIIVNTETKEIVEAVRTLGENTWPISPDEIELEETEEGYLAVRIYRTQEKDETPLILTEIIIDPRQVSKEAEVEVVSATQKRYLQFEDGALGFAQRVSFDSELYVVDNVAAGLASHPLVFDFGSVDVTPRLGTLEDKRLSLFFIYMNRNFIHSDPDIDFYLKIGDKGHPMCVFELHGPDSFEGEFHAISLYAPLGQVISNQAVIDLFGEEYLDHRDRISDRMVAEKLLAGEVKRISLLRNGHWDSAKATIASFADMDLLEVQLPNYAGGVAAPYLRFHVHPYLGCAEPAMQGISQLYQWATPEKCAEYHIDPEDVGRLKRLPGDVIVLGPSYIDVLAYYDLADRTGPMVFAIGTQAIVGKNCKKREAQTRFYSMDSLPQEARKLAREMIELLSREEITDDFHAAHLKFIILVADQMRMPRAFGGNEKRMLARRIRDEQPPSTPPNFGTAGHGDIRRNISAEEVEMIIAEDGAEAPVEEEAISPEAAQERFERGIEDQRDLLAELASIEPDPGGVIKEKKRRIVYIQGSLPPRLEGSFKTCTEAFLEKCGLGAVHVATRGIGAVEEEEKDTETLYVIDRDRFEECHGRIKGRALVVDKIDNYGPRDVTSCVLPPETAALSLGLLFTDQTDIDREKSPGAEPGIATKTRNLYRKARERDDIELDDIGAIVSWRDRIEDVWNLLHKLAIAPVKLLGDIGEALKVLEYIWGQA